MASRLRKTKWRRITKLPERCKIIKELRLKEGISQQYIALRLNIAPSTYGKIETNDRQLSDSEAEMLAAILGTGIKFNEI